MSNKDKNLVKLMLFILSFCLLYYIAIPLYSGDGNNILKKESILYLSSNLKKADEDISKAQSLIAWITNTFKDYNSVTTQTKDRVYYAVKEDIDTLRTLNDLMLFFKRNGMDIDMPGYSVDSKKDPGIKTHSYAISSETDYYNFLKLIKNINNSLQIYNIKSITVTPGDSPISNEISYSLVLENYQYIK